MTTPCHLDPDYLYDKGVEAKMEDDYNKKLGAKAQVEYQDYLKERAGEAKYQLKEMAEQIRRDPDFIERFTPTHDPVNHPQHYRNHPSGIECIQITRHMSFNIGNAIKYLWRADYKDAPIQDLEKAIWYIKDEIEKRHRAEIQSVGRALGAPAGPKITAGYP